SSSAARSSSISGEFSAFSAFGRLSLMRPTLSCVSTSIFTKAIGTLRRSALSERGANEKGRATAALFDSGINAGGRASRCATAIPVVCAHGGRAVVLQPVKQRRREVALGERRDDDHDILPRH